MKVCVDCGNQQELGDACNRCKKVALLPLDFVKDVYGPNWKNVFEKKVMTAGPKHKVRVSITLPDGVASSTWQSTGVPH